MKLEVSFPPISNAIKLDGQGDGGSMTLVFDRSQVEKVPELYKLMGNSFIIDINMVRGE